MASDKSRDFYQGVLCWDPRFSTSSLWPAEASYTQAGPRPGVPEAQDNSDLVLEASGSQSASKALRLEVIRAGNPTAASSAGTFGWKNDGDSSYRGWDLPGPVSAWEPVQWTDGTGAVVSMKWADAVTTVNDVVVVVSEQRYTTPSAVSRVVASKRATDGTWTNSHLVGPSQATAPTHGYHPALVLLPSGRILCFVLREIGTTDAQIDMYYSDDDGVSWSLGAKSCLESSIDIDSLPGAGNGGYDIDRMRAAYKDGQILLLVGLLAHDNTAGRNRATIQQYASVNLGARFDAIGSAWDVTARSAAFPDVTTAGGWFVVVYGGEERTSLVGADVRMIRVSNAYQELQDEVADVVTLATDQFNPDASAQYYDDGDLAVTTDRDEVVWIYFRDAEGVGDDQHTIRVHRSFDYGDTSQLGDVPQGNLCFSMPNGGTAHLRDFCATPCQGRIVLLHNWDAGTGDEDNSLAAMYLGGWSTVTLPSIEQSAGRRSGVWSNSWIPIELPHDVTDWTRAGSGGTWTLTSGYAELAVSTAQDYEENAAMTGTATEGLIAKFALQVSSGGSLTANHVAVQLRSDDGSAGYQVTIRFLLNGVNTQYRVYDDNGSAQLGSDQTIASNGQVEILAAMSAGVLEVWHRVGGTSSDREWTAGVSSTAMSDDSGAVGNHRVRFGAIVANSSTSRWYGAHLTSDFETGDHLAPAPTNPDELRGRRLSVHPVYVDDGVFVRAVSGPGFFGDTFHVDTRYDYEVQRLFPTVARSPRVGWRSTGTTEATIALAYDSTLLGTKESDPGNDIVGIGLYGCNGWRTGELQGYDQGSTSWVTLATINLADGLTGMNFDRNGASIEPTGTPTSKPYLYRSECRGWFFDLGSSKVRKVRTNSEGRWHSGTRKRATLYLEGVDDSEPTTGAAGRLIPSDAVILVNVLGATYAGLRLKIDAGQVTPDGDYRIGSIVCGPAAIFGQPYGWGRVVATVAGSELSEAADRTTRSREVAPAQRVVEIGWHDGIDESNSSAADGEPDPDYVAGSTSSGAEPVASTTDTAAQLGGTLRDSAGPNVQIVYLPRVAKSTGAATDVITLNRRAEHMLCRFASEVRVEVVQGDELVDEVVRVGTVALVEEV